MPYICKPADRRQSLDGFEKPGWNGRGLKIAVAAVIVGLFFSSGTGRGKMKMGNVWKMGATLAMTAWMGLSSPAALAAMSFEATLSSSPGDVVAVPLGQAMPTFTFTFDNAFDLGVFALTVEYNPALLTFNPAVSTLSDGTDSATIPEVLFHLWTVSGEDLQYSASGSAGQYSIAGGYVFESYLIPAGSIVLTGMFDLTPAFTAGMVTPVRVHGELLDTSFNPETFDMTASVSAVPEPESWLMLLAGVGLIAARVRRSSCRMQRGTVPA